MHFKIIQPIVRYLKCEKKKINNKKKEEIKKEILNPKA